MTLEHHFCHNMPLPFSLRIHFFHHGTLINLIYPFSLHPFLLPSLPPERVCICSRTGGAVFWLPAKLMSKCHPHATRTQISYFLLLSFLLSVCISLPPPQFPFCLLFAVENSLIFIQNKMGGLTTSSSFMSFVASLFFIFHYSAFCLFLVYNYYQMYILQTLLARSDLL